MENGDGKHLIILHLYTNYKITDRPVCDMTVLQYQAILRITEEIMKYKQNNTPMVVI